MRKLSAAELEREAREAKWAATTPEEVLRIRLDESVDDTDPVTREFLRLAVPLWIERSRYWRPAYRVQRAGELARVVTAPGAAAFVDRAVRRRDAIGYTFNAVAEGLALLAYCPGGVTFAGQHWEAQRAEVPA